MINNAFSPALLTSCTLCPRQCGGDRRQGTKGYCRIGEDLAIASITLHRGEEPVLSGTRGICNVFFAHCNLRCLYCQNVQISRNETALQHGDWSLPQVVDRIASILDTGVNRLGFVSPSHMAQQMVSIVQALHQRGYHPVVVYNSNGYDRVKTLRALEPWVDVYLPDYKYSDPFLAGQWSGAVEYPEVAAAALKEMYRQKGNLLHLDDEGLALRGLIVRHLVLPGAVGNSLGVLRFLAEELSSRITLSLMSQYQPIAEVAAMELLGRTLLPEEYALVVAEMDQLGFENGWVQEFASAAYYNPDFSRATPFGE
ncbi:MAG: radical SAM protein [Desulfobulbus sp.]|nr:radical SAM protein [Desulfobulbus sp.]